ncbi:hypothetical protein, partial [Burkholderia pseudomallei]|uniref:hypothetical protein n=1 Tax=Burkholderia pseudomallei TaxID=28450 RepID=UPI0026E52B25
KGKRQKAKGKRQKAKGKRQPRLGARIDRRAASPVRRGARFAGAECLRARAVPGMSTAARRPRSN